MKIKSHYSKLADRRIRDYIASHSIERAESKVHSEGQSLKDSSFDWWKNIMSLNRGLVTIPVHADSKRFLEY